MLWANELAAGDDGAGLDVAVAVPMAPIGDLTVAMTTYAGTPDMAAFPIQLAATWPGVEPVDAADVLTPAAIERLDHLQHDRLARLVRVFGGDPARWVRVDGFATPSWSAALRTQSPGGRRGAAPLFIVHGEDDTAVRLDWATRWSTGSPPPARTSSCAPTPAPTTWVSATPLATDVVGRIVEAMSS